MRYGEKSSQPKERRNTQRNGSVFMGKNLNFKEKNIENSYRQYLLGYKQKYFRFFQIAVLLTLTFNWLINPLGMDNFNERALTFNLIQIILHTIGAIYLHYKKDFKYPEEGIFILQVYTCIGYVESSQKNFHLFTRTNFISTSTLLELNSLVSMISRSSWKTNGISSLILNTYLSLRFADLTDNKEMRGLPTLIYFANFLIMTLGTYFHEKYDRNLFYQRFTSQESLKRFEEIIREILPSSIIIYRGEELQFFNEEVRRMLKVDDNNSVEEQIKNISVTTSASDLKKNINYEEFDSLQNIMLPNNHCDQNDQLNLFAYLKQIKKFKKRKGFLSLTGLYRSSDPATLMQNPSGETTYLNIKIGTVAWEGRDAVIAILSEDLVMHKLNYLQEQDKYKDKLLATVSHDLRTPLNGIIGMLEIVLEGPLERRVKKCLQLAQRSSHLLLFMINDILDFSQIANGCLKINPVEFFLEDIITDISKLFKFQAKKKGIKFELQNLLPKQGKNILFSDPNRLKQVILNLLGNAVKFTQEGFVKITLELDENDITNYGNQAFRISVEDTGCGIKENDIPKLFKLFGMLKNSESQKLNSSGVGLGLAISQNLIKIMNNERVDGIITVRSEHGKGSTFTFPIYNMITDQSSKEFRVPLRGIRLNTLSGKEMIPNDDAPELEKALPTLKSNSNYKILRNIKANKKRILIVDDDQINIFVMSTFLDKFNDCEYFTAFNGQDALNIVKQKAKYNKFFDIIFMDCNMPVMDGFEATQKILNLVSENEIPNLFIIASSGNASQLDKQACLECGMIDFITKPYKTKDLREKIDIYYNQLVFT